MNYQIEDGSRDKNYFTIIPNYILEKCNATPLAIYLQLKRMAGEKSTAYPSQTTLVSKLNISENTLRKGLKTLIEKGFIKHIGNRSVKTIGGTQKVKEYRIVDIWHINTRYFMDKYKGGSKYDTPLPKGGSKSYQKGVQNVATNKNPNNKKETSYEVKEQTAEEKQRLYLLKEQISKSIKRA